MRIQHNIMAMNAYRNYSSNTNALGKNLEKLSSGYKINRAGDDAAGLAISEKMRAQITGLKTAQKNSKDGISLIQTAEGALTEVHSMLNRMVELADQSANGTYQNSPDRDNLQKEFSALRTEIDRISQASNFNGINLLDGTQEVTTTNNAQSVTVAIAATAGVGVTAVAGTHTIEHVEGKSAKATEFVIDLQGMSFNANAAGVTIQLTIGNASGTATIVGALGAAGEHDATKAAAAFAATNGGTVAVNGITYDIKASGSKLTFTMVSLPTKASTTAQLSGNFSVSVAGATNAPSTGSVNTSSQVITEGVAPKDGTLASTFINMTSAMVTDGARLTLGGETYTFSFEKTTEAGKVDVSDLLNAAGTGMKDNDAFKTAMDRLTIAAAGNKMFTVGHNKTDGKITLQEKSDYVANGGKADLTTGAKIQEQISMDDGAGVSTSGGLTLQIGESSAKFNQLTVDIGKMDAASLNLSGIDISSQLGAQNAVGTLQTAINTVSSTRGDLGALQNRLEHTINNLSVMTENIQDAEANIRDVDVAEEMMAYTKNNILVQSAQAMLAQANQVPQGVLQLLQ